MHFLCMTTNNIPFMINIGPLIFHAGTLLILHHFKKCNFDSIENTGYHMLCGKSLKLISLFCSVHTLYALGKLSVLIAVNKWP